jgi:ribosomal protein S18 acetylase RimI-like enzyme
VNGDPATWERMLASMWSFFPTVAGASERGRTLVLDGVQAGVTPAIPERSLPNSVLYRHEEALEAALPELARAYEDEGVLAWTVWVPEHHQRARQILEEAGHVLDASPTAMVVSLDEVEPPREGDPEPDPEPSIEDVARINDLAYGTGDAFQRIMGEGQADPAYHYVARESGNPVASVVSHDHEGDCSMWWVATVPEARGRGLAAGLMRHALADGRARGCEITTLQATKLGRPVYERLGYKGFGAIEMWERRRAPAEAA